MQLFGTAQTALSLPTARMHAPGSPFGAHGPQAAPTPEHIWNSAAAMEMSVVDVAGVGGGTYVVDVVTVTVVGGVGA